jgi:hypothetical protein
MLRLIFKALLALLVFDAARCGKSVQRVQRIVGWWKVKGVPQNVSAEQVCEAINYACVWYPKRVRCVQRATVTVCLLRRFDIPAQLVMGAQKLPFKAHAWAEVDGCPVNERRDVRKRYAVWLRC